MEASSSNNVMVNPNRHRAESKATRGGGDHAGDRELAAHSGDRRGWCLALPPSQQVFTFASIILFLLMAFYVFRWSRGVLVPILLLLVTFAVRGFNQAWNIEVAVPRRRRTRT